MSRAKRPLNQPVLSSSDPIDVETEPAQTYKPAESFPFPRDAAFVSVEYPGYVADIDKVFETLGGRECVGKVTSDASTFLELRYRPSDPFSHPIVGDAIDTSNLLLKITRKRRKAKDGRPAGPWEEKQEILGEIVRTVRFRAMADFQYTPDPSWNTTQLRQALQDVDVQEIFRLSTQTDEEPTSLRNIPPPIFSRIDVPQTYGFRQNPAVVKIPDDSGQGYKLINKQRAQRLVAHFYDPKAPTVPSEPPAQALKDAAKLDQTLVDRVKELFQQRPMWSRLALANALPPEGRRYIRKLLPLAAFFVSAGPYRESWVRYGYDFRRDPESRFYQTVDVRFVKEAKPLARAKRLLEGKAVRAVLKEGEAAATPAVEDPNSHLFDGVNKRDITIYQLIDLTEPTLSAMVRSEVETRASYDDKEGWFMKRKMDVIREELRGQYLKLANRTDERPKTLAAAQQGEKKARRKKKTASDEDGSGSLDEATPKGKGKAKKGKEKLDGPSAASAPAPSGVRPVANKELNAKVDALMRNLNQSTISGTRAEHGSDSPSEDEESERGSGSDEEVEVENGEEEEELPDFYDDIFGGESGEESD